MKIRPLCHAVALFAGLAGPAHAQLTFNLVHDPGMDSQVLAAFQTAAAEWSAVISDHITVTINIGYDTTPGAGVLGSTSSSFIGVSYSQFKTALTADRTSASDNAAVASLQAGSSYSFRVNTPGTPNSFTTGSGDTLAMTRANARALGLYQASGGIADASITFNSSFAFDFNPANGITGGTYDFVGVAAHEIGHVLGFFSGVDVLDQHPTLAVNQQWQTSLDLFRFSTASAGLHLFDESADASAKYFSIDGGTTDLGDFSTGVTYGDGRQASHWKDGLGLGIMDPTAAPGELLTITALDLKAFDVIGYNLVVVPEPTTLALMFGTAAGLVALSRRRRTGN